MESKIITPNQIHDFFMELVKNNNFIQTMNDYEILEVKKYAEKMLLKSEKESIEIAEVNPNYHYPDKYKDNHPKYWIETIRSNTDYFNCNKVLNIITTFIPIPNNDGLKTLFKNELLPKIQQLENKFIESKSMPNDDKKEIKSKLFKGFQSSLNDIQIEYLFEQLKCNYIDESTDKDNFKAIFKNKQLPVNFIPVKRLNQFTVALMAYFIYELFQSENQSNYWQIAENCFDVKNLRQSYTNAFKNKDKEPKGFNELKNIIKSLDNPLQ